MDEKKFDAEMLKELDILLDLDILEDESDWDPLANMNDIDQPEDGQ